MANSLSSLCLESERLCLRYGKPGDIDAILRYYQDNRAYLEPFEPHKSEDFYTRLYWEKLLQQRVVEAKHSRSFKLFLFLKQSASGSQQQLIGSLNFSNFTRGIFQNCTVGYSLAESYQGHGYMSEALTVSIDYVFSMLRFHRIEANYLPHNQRSGNLLKRLGFTVNGYARNYLYINGRWQDHVLTSLLSPVERACEA